MSNEIAVTSASQTVSVFSGEIAFVAGQRMAKALSSSTMVPEAYRGEQNIGNCLIALEVANRTGASILAVMQSLVVVHGRPTWEAKFLIGTINTCGRFSPMRYQFQGTEGTDDWGCRAIATDRQSGEELIGTLITIKTAKDEGWYGKNGSKWKTIPEQMLRYRAASFWTRAYAPELSLGMQTRDEVEDYIDVTPEVEKGEVRQRRTRPAAAIPEAATDPDPMPTDPPTVVPVTVVTPEPPADNPRAKLAAWLTANGFTYGDLRLVNLAQGCWEGDPETVDELTDEAVAYCRAKAKALLPLLKAVKEGGAK